MSTGILLADVKADLRLGSDTTEDARLERLIAAAGRAVERRTGHVIFGTEPTLPEADLPAVQQAISLIVATWYALPEGSSVDGRAGAAELPLGVSWLLDPIKKWADD